MKTKDILFNVINDLEEFENSNNNFSYEEFICFLAQKHTLKIENNTFLTGNIKIKELEGFTDNNDRDATILISFMYKYAKNYLKKALENSIINTQDEFSFLITMVRNESLSKTELINLLVTEKTSGIETIKRLTKKGLLEEFKTLNNKKNVRLKITDFGKETIFKVLPSVSKVTKIVTGNLNELEKITFLNLLKKLDLFHNEIYFDNLNISIEDIYKNKLT